MDVTDKISFEFAFALLCLSLEFKSVVIAQLP